ncbi:hypothetical protein RI129_006652 [Pyrocoelia pectoralis]|uniref:N-acyl-aliphatic-L-amino acid amidohydrolase n=1 Tax=Pyrocoelia pectoralis TaxID=417401 RepID=A0AAN7ZJU8_9COLE
MKASPEELDTVAVANFRQYLRIPSVHPNIDYEPCVVFLEKQAKDIGLEFSVFRDVPKNPMVVLTWSGKEKSLPSIMLNSHMDVVPVFEDKWTHKPFDADIDENGNIYARGSQDTKCTGIQYLEAIRRLKLKGVEPRRTVHVTFLPDEELGGINGAKQYVETENFKKLNIGFALDEGFGGRGDTLIVFNGEKRRWIFRIHCPGQSGHGSLLLENTAGEKVRHILDKVYDFRAEQKIKEDKDKKTDHVTTINLTMIEGGLQNNVIPDKFTLVFDARVPIENFEKFEQTVNQWCKDTGEGIWTEDLQKDDDLPITAADDSNIFWVAFKHAVQLMDFKVDPLIFPANTDGRYFRKALIPTFGFSPNQDTPTKLHDHDEFLNIDVFLKGIKLYTHIIPALSNA